MDKIVTIASFDNDIDAQIALGKLKNEDIECYLENENIASTIWLWNNAVGGIKVKVFEKDAERAYKILHPEVQKEPVLCPNCNSSNIKELMFDRRVMGYLKMIFLFASIVFVLLFGMKRKTKHKYWCLDCGARFYEDVEE